MEFRVLNEHYKVTDKFEGHIYDFFFFFYITISNSGHCCEIFNLNNRLLTVISANYVQHVRPIKGGLAMWYVTNIKHQHDNNAKNIILISNILYTKISMRMSIIF